MTNFVIVQFLTPTQEVAGMITILDKKFKSGNVGYFGNGKVVINGKAYQAQAQLVALGSDADVQTEDDDE